MIKVKVYGCSKNKVLKNLILRAAYFFIRELMPRKRNLIVTIFMKSNILEDEGVYGECYSMDLYDIGCDYTIRMDLNETDNMIISTLAHEMVHVKQFSRKELTILNGDYCAKWKGNKFSDSTEYEEMPWEIEADTIEQQLSEKFFKNRIK